VRWQKVAKKIFLPFSKANMVL